MSSTGNSKDGDVRCVERFPPRPKHADGAFLRLISLCDSYTMESYPRVRTAILAARERAEADPRGCVVLAVHSGDFLSPSPITSIDLGDSISAPGLLRLGCACSKSFHALLLPVFSDTPCLPPWNTAALRPLCVPSGKSMMEGLNRIPVDLVCFGNHEFDLPEPVLQKRIQEFQGTWLNANIRDPQFVGRDGEVLPGYAMVSVGERRVAIGGFCTGQQDIYRPGTLNDVTPVAESVLEVWRQAASEGADALVPLTHQLMHEDRELAAALQEDPDARGHVPILLGGHDHDLFEEEGAGGIKILKVGQDAVTIGVVDIFWTASGELRSSYSLLPSADFPPDPDLAAMVARTDAMLEGMCEVKICDLPRAMSSKGVRRETQGISTLLCTKIKRSLRPADICLLQGGCVRGRADYPAGPFTYGDLMEEMPFDTEIATVALPGWVIAESVIRSRASGPGSEQPTFLHHDEDTVFRERPGGGGLECVSINRQPFDPKRDYCVAIYHVLVIGMNEIQPLLSHIRGSGMRVPARDDTIPGKQLVLEQCMREQWRSLLPDKGTPASRTAATDAQSEDGKVPSEGESVCVLVRAESQVGPLFRQLDANHDGVVSKDELAEFLRAHHLLTGDGEGPSEQLLTWLMSAADEDHDGCISLPELRRTMLED